MAKVLKTIIVYFKLHLSVRMWEFDCKRLDKNYIYALTVYTVICWQTMSLRYRKEKTALDSTKNKTKKQETRNVNIGQSRLGKLFMQCCRNYSAVFLHLQMFLSVGQQILIHITQISSLDAPLSYFSKLVDRWLI